MMGVGFGMFGGVLPTLPILALARWPTGFAAAAILIPCLFIGRLVGRRFGRFMNRDRD